MKEREGRNSAYRHIAPMALEWLDIGFSEVPGTAVAFHVAGELGRLESLLRMDAEGMLTPLARILARPSATWDNRRLTPVDKQSIARTLFGVLNGILNTSGRPASEIAHRLFQLF